MQDGAGGPGPVMEEGPEAFGDGQDPLTDGYVGDDVVHQVSRRPGHPLGVTGGTNASGLARESDQELVTTAGAPGPSKAVGQDAACQVAPELLLHMIRYAVAHGVGLIGQGQVGLQVFPDDAVERGGLGAAPAIELGLGGGRRPGRRRGPPCCSLCWPGLCGHRKPPASRGARRSVSTPRTARGWSGGMAEAAGSDGGRSRY